MNFYQKKFNSLIFQKRKAYHPKKGQKMCFNFYSQNIEDFVQKKNAIQSLYVKMIKKCQQSENSKNVPPYGLRMFQWSLKKFMNFYQKKFNPLIFQKRKAYHPKKGQKMCFNFYSQNIEDFVQKKTPLTLCV